MEVVQKERWYFMALVLFPFLQGACADTAPPEIETVTIHLQEGMILDCLCPWVGNLTMVSWTKDPDTNSIAVFHPDYGVATTYHYRERIEFLRSTPMDGSITMKNVTHQDIGLYHCSVQTFPQGPWIRNIQVEDLDGPPVEDNEDNAEVMEAGAHMTAETSGNLSVECNQQRNGTIVHQAMVEHMAFGQPWVIIGICKRVEGGVLSEDYSERGQVTCQQNLDVSLQLTAVAQEDGGLYRCSFSTDTGLQTNTVMVTVLPSGFFTLSVFMMYLYLAIATTGLILLTVLLIVLLRRRKKSRREESRDKVHPADPHTPDSQTSQFWRRWWARELCGQVY
ncbi:CD226 antigen isoform X1 [Syngnathus acus]|uniref:CD226 antigen isoform X1 n=1 Tax=Syngnathus acus TaxID=161584 RepID=UPI0018863FAF|nr:CD226 antigen isoform X1 [Syngnathus acus]